MEARIASASVSGSFLLFFLSFWTTGVSSFENGARISVFLANAVCNYTENEPAINLALTDPRFKELIKVRPKDWQGPSGFLKKVGDAEFKLKVTSAQIQTRSASPQGTISCWLGSCGNIWSEGGCAECIMQYNETLFTQFRAFLPGEVNYCRSPEFKCWCDICNTNLCNDPATANCGPYKPPCEVLPPPPTLEPPKFSCYKAVGCDEEPSFEASMFPECIVAYSKGVPSQLVFRAQKETQGKCPDGLKDCKFCYTGKCNNPKKYCAASQTK